MTARLWPRQALQYTTVDGARILPFPSQMPARSVAPAVRSALKKHLVHEHGVPARNGSPLRIVYIRHAPGTWSGVEDVLDVYEVHAEEPPRAVAGDGPPCALVRVRREAGAVAVVPQRREERKEMDVMTLLPLYEVDVPIRNTAGSRGVHVFTGHADSRSAAVRIAHEVYDQAAAARQAGLEVPGRRPDGWTARGYRPGWELDWKAATVGRWNDPYSWTRATTATSSCRSAPGQALTASKPTACPGPSHPVRDEREIPSMDSVLRTQARFGQRTLLLTTAAVPLTGWAVHAIALHRRLAATRCDPLTGLLRRDAYTARARRLLARHGDVAVVMVDSDRFKEINDRLGHAAGDTVLASIAARLTAWAGPQAAVGRLGGDEFAVVLQLPADRRALRLEQLVRMLHTPVTLENGRTVDVAASVGAATPDVVGSRDLSALQRAADAALYDGKHSGQAILATAAHVSCRPSTGAARAGPTRRCGGEPHEHQNLPSAGDWIRGITIRQPWATCILAGKNVENRPAHWPWRGWVLIHAGKAKPDPALLRDPLVATAIRGRELHRGAVIGVARLTDCHLDQGPEHCTSRWAQRGAHHLVLDDVRELPLPVPATGALPAWRPTPDLVAQVLQQLPDLRL